MAQRIAQQSRHILEIDGKKYELTASESPESLDPDQVQNITILYNMPSNSVRRVNLNCFALGFLGCLKLNSNG